MQSTVKIGNTEALKQTFKDIYELRKYLENTDYNKENKSHKQSDDGSWAGTRTFKQALELLTFGFDVTKDEYYKKYSTKVKTSPLNNTLASMPKKFNNVKGFTPIVANALLGLPHSMVDINKSPDAKIINLYISPFGSASVQDENYMIFNVYVYNAIKLIEQKTKHKVNLYIYNFTEGAYYGKVKDSLVVLKMKHSNELLNIKKHGFSIGHPAFQRRIMFAVRDRNSQKLETSSGMGIDYSYHNTQEKIAEIINNEFCKSGNGNNIIISKQMPKFEESYTFEDFWNEFFEGKL